MGAEEDMVIGVHGIPPFGTALRPSSPQCLGSFGTSDRLGAQETTTVQKDPTNRFVLGLRSRMWASWGGSSATLPPKSSNETLHRSTGAVPKIRGPFWGAPILRLPSYLANIDRDPDFWKLLHKYCSRG